MYLFCCRDLGFLTLVKRKKKILTDVLDLFQTKICEEFPAEVDLETKAWKVLTWTAIGLGIAATASFFTSH